jgi:hypothetical protein
MEGSIDLKLNARQIVILGHNFSMSASPEGKSGGFLFAGNHLEWAVIALAFARLGLILVPTFVTLQITNHRCVS